jgi:protein-S-isoprenylcysteine O-methyltransferase Ste14
LANAAPLGLAEPSVLDSVSHAQHQCPVFAALDWHRWKAVSPDRWLGATLAIAGAALYGMACYALGRGNLYCGKDGLVTGGIYRWTRNPQYATAIPAYLGLALASYSLGALVLAIFLALTFVLMALAEEPWLEANYGDDYRAYQRRVARFYNWRHGPIVLKTESSRLERALKGARS